MKKLFDNVYDVNMVTEDDLPKIKGIVSGEKEAIDIKDVSCTKAVEGWLKAVDEKITESLIAKMQKGAETYVGQVNSGELNRGDWVKNHCSQVACTVCMIQWTSETEEAIINPDNMEERLDEQKEFLDELTKMVGDPELESVLRKRVVALITADVHNRDIVKMLKDGRVDNMADFRWSQQLRF